MYVPPFLEDRAVSEALPAVTFSYQSKYRFGVTFAHDGPPPRSFPSPKLLIAKPSTTPFLGLFTKKQKQKKAIAACVHTKQLCGLLN